MNVQLTTDRGIQLCDDLNIKHVISTPNLIFFSDGDCLDSKVKEANEIVSEKYYIVNITHNQNLVKKWLFKEVIRTN